MRVLYVIDSLGFGGAERQLVELIKGVYRKKYEIFLCCLIDDPDGYADEIHSLGIQIEYFPRKFFFDIRPIIKIARYIKETEIDIVHSFLTIGALFGVIAAKISGRRVICSGIRDAKDRSVMFWIYKRIESVLSDCFVSNSMVGFTNRFKKIKTNFYVIYNGIDFKRFDLGNVNLTALRKELGISQFNIVVGMVASLSDHKDHETLLDAVSLVLKRFPNACFLLIGDGPEYKKLLRKAQTQGIKENVIFAGYRFDVEKIYCVMNVSVLVTQNKNHLEGISNSIMESMVSGVPVIASSGGGTDEVIVHGRNGLTVPPADSKQLAESIIYVLSNQKNAKAMAQNALQDVRAKFGLDRYVKDYVSLYHEGLGQG